MRDRDDVLVRAVKAGAYRALLGFLGEERASERANQIAGMVQGLDPNDEETGIVEAIMAALNVCFDRGWIPTGPDRKRYACRDKPSILDGSWSTETIRNHIALNCLNQIFRELMR